jgi:hypothetical protein
MKIRPVVAEFFHVYSIDRQTDNRTRRIQYSLFVILPMRPKAINLEYINSHNVAEKWRRGNDSSTAYWASRRRKWKTALWRSVGTVTWVPNFHVVGELLNDSKRITWHCITSSVCLSFYRNIAISLSLFSSVSGGRRLTSRCALWPANIS